MTKKKAPPTRKKTSRPSASPRKKHLGPTPLIAGQRLFAEPKFIPLLPGQLTDGEVTHYDAYASVLQPIPPPRKGASLVLNLADVIGQQAVDQITQSGKIVFHSIGDTGADKEIRVAAEADVAKLMANDMAVSIATVERPSFFYHLGDIVYEFGQADSYYGQFYEPYCMYNAPIFAIPGNHDGMVWDQSMTSLQAFLNNFCAATPGPAPNAGGLLRSTMTQPGVYFTLQAPFVTIIGLYSNIVDKGNGVISSEGKAQYQKIITDDQKSFLIAELQRLAPIRKNNQTAVIVAVHHPPFTGNDASTNTLGLDMDDAFKKGGLWPDLVLSGHAHLYERFERTVNGFKIPYIVAGVGGYNLSPFAIASDPNAKVPPSLAGKDPSLQAYIKAFGYMKVKATSGKLAVIFNCTDPAYGPAADSIVIDLATHVITEGIKGREPL